MITYPKVLVLGAGASMPYGFPSGLDLLKTIDGKLNPNSSGNLIKILNNFDISENDIMIFRQDLINSNAPSVDAFLEHRTEFLLLGKLAITLSLIPYEDEYKLFDIKSREQSWYAYLFNKLNAPFEAFDENKLSIITFNYDRSIEHFLFKAIKSKYRKSDEECADKLNKIPIIHVHGRLGALPWQEEGGRPYLNRADILKPENIKSISEQIIIIPEAEDTSPAFEHAFNLMKSSNDIYFLGFGYHEMNLRRLKTDILKLQNMSGTGYGLGKAEMIPIKGKWRISIPEPNLKILEFLKNWITLS